MNPVDTQRVIEAIEHHIDPDVAAKSAAYRLELEARALQNIKTLQAIVGQPTPAGFNRYCQFVGRRDDGRNIVQAAIHRSWASHSSWCHAHGLVPVVLSPWGHGKSVQRIAFQAAWMLGLNPDLRILAVTNSDANAKSRVSVVLQLLLTQEHQLLFPSQAIEKKNLLEIHLERAGMSGDPSFRAATVFTAGVGSRCEVLLFDDTADYKNSIEEPVRRPKVLESMEGQWNSRLVKRSPGDRRPFVSWREMIGTRWHDLDCWGSIKQSPGYCVLVQAVSKDNARIDCVVVCGDGQLDMRDYPSAKQLTRRDFQADCKPAKVEDATKIRGYEQGRAIGSIPLWRDGGWNQDALNAEERKRPRWHDCGRRQRPFSTGELVFPHFSECFQYMAPPDEVPEGWTVVFGVDLAGKKRRGNAIFVAMSDGVLRIPLDVLVLKCSSTELSNHLTRLFRRWAPSRIIVEDNGYQGSLIEWGKESKAPWTSVVQPFTTTGQKKYDPVTGVATLDVEYGNAAWKIPSKQWDGHDDSCDCSWCLWRQIMSTCTSSDLRTRTDAVDSIMAQWFCREGLLRCFRGGRIVYARQDLDMGAGGIAQASLGLPMGPTPSATANPAEAEPAPGVLATGDARTRKEKEREAMRQTLRAGMTGLGFPFGG